MSLASNLASAFTRVGTEFKTIRTLIGGSGTADISALETTDKSSLVAAVNEINDATTTTTSTWSSSKTSSSISTAVANLVNSAPTTLDTLGEIATQLASDESAAASLTTAVGNRVRFDASQTLDAGQQTQAQTNMGVTAASDIGSVSTDFAAGFVSALS